MVSACRCKFQHKKDAKWETGIAITQTFGTSDVICIIPDWAISHNDAPVNMWDYKLDWTHSIDGDALLAQEDKQCG